MLQVTVKTTTAMGATRHRANSNNPNIAIAISIQPWTAVFQTGL
jgi:hypothetical protein